MSATGHHFVKRYRAIPWAVCLHCGLIRLNNEATRKARCER